MAKQKMRTWQSNFASMISIVATEILDCLFKEEEVVIFQVKRFELIRLFPPRKELIEAN